MRFIMFIIPKIYQPDMPPGERAGEGFTPPAESVARMMKFNEELAKAGALISLDGLHPISKGARVTFSGGKRSAIERLSGDIELRIRKFCNGFIGKYSRDSMERWLESFAGFRNRMKYSKGALS